jgi:PLP dependent protein
MSDSPLVTAVSQNYKKVHQRIQSACGFLGRAQNEVKLIAVTKGQSEAKILAGYEVGMRDFGENYLQELQSKAHALKHLKDITWHYLGKIQSRKIPLLIELRAVIHTLDKLEHARSMQKSLEKLNDDSMTSVFLQANLEAEPQKGGLGFDATLALAQQIVAEYPRVRIQGVMGIPSRNISIGTSVQQVPEVYAQLRILGNAIGQRRLSLGMSSDLEAAIAAGSDIVRVGTAIFGARGT